MGKRTCDEQEVLEKFTEALEEVEVDEIESFIGLLKTKPAKDGEQRTTAAVLGVGKDLIGLLGTICLKDENFEKVLRETIDVLDSFRKAKSEGKVCGVCGGDHETPEGAKALEKILGIKEGKLGDVIDDLKKTIEKHIKG